MAVLEAPVVFSCRRCRVLVSAGKLSLGPRERDMVRTGRSAASPHLPEVGVGAAIPPDRQTQVDVRRRDRWVGDGNDAGVDGHGVVAMAPGREWILRLAAVGMSPTRLARYAEILPMAGMAQCRAPRRDTEGSVVEGLGVPAPFRPTPQTNRLNTGANPWSSG